MASEYAPGQPERDTGTGGEVVYPDTWTRAPRDAEPHGAAAPPPATEPDTAPTGGEDTGDALEGTIVRVDQPAAARRDGEWLAALADSAAHRRPVIHPVLKSRAELAATARWVSAHYALTSAYHVTRTPKYAARLAFRSPRGASRLTGGLYRWALDVEGWPPS
jgi:DNA segregation ATPase FtsK/SpoIIIE, S-DNA-T family